MEVLSDNKEKLPEWPVDPSDKKAQQFIRDIIHRGTEEAFEALLHLKNWKPHKHTEIKEFNRDAFLEEMVDDFTYKLEVLILMGFSAEDLFDAFSAKNRKNVARAKGDY
jgi:predicted house-cleaning noncanonical NTP pyrophosphatase (MazG superfamily)